MSEALVLIVEDESLLATDLKAKLERVGHRVLAIAESGDEALRQAADVRPDLALMDIHLRGQLDGVEVARLLWMTHGVPVIFLSADSGPETVERAQASGAFGYLLKPVDDRELEIAIEMALSKHHADEQLRASEWWFRNVFRSVGEGLIATDAAGVVRFTNPEAERILGLTGPEAVGQPIASVFRIVDESTEREITDPISRVLGEGRIIRHPVRGRLLRTDRRVEYAAAPIMGDVAVAGAAVVVREVMDFRDTATVWNELVSLVARPPGNAYDDED